MVFSAPTFANEDVLADAGCDFKMPPIHKERPKLYDKNGKELTAPPQKGQKVYDAKGNVLGESYAYLSNLEKGKTWNFKSVYDEIDSKDALRFEIREVTYFAGM